MAPSELIACNVLHAEAGPTTSLKPVRDKSDGGGYRGYCDAACHKTPHDYRVKHCVARSHSSHTKAPNENLWIDEGHVKREGGGY